MVAHAGARDRVVGWSRVPKPTTVWFGCDEAGAVSRRVVMFWRSDVPGHSIAGGVWGSVGCGQQLPGGGGPSGAYVGVCSRQGRGWFRSLAVCARHTTTVGPGRCASRSPRPLGIVVVVYASRNLWPPGGGGPVVACVGTCGHREELWLVAGSQDRGPAVAEVWVGVGLAGFSGSKPCPQGFEEGSGRADAKDMTRETLSFSVA